MRTMKLFAATAMVAAGCCSATGLAHAEPDQPEPPPAPKTVIDTDGTYKVGTDIEPGTYRSEGPAENATCYWKRVNGDKIIDNAMTKKPQVVQIEPSDTAFKTSHCQTWQKTDCLPGCAPPPPNPGLIPGVLKDFLGHPPPPPPAPGGH